MASRHVSRMPRLIRVPAALVALLLLVSLSVGRSADTLSVPEPDLKLALQLRSDLRYEAAKEVFRAWLARHPDDGQAFFDFGYTLYLQSVGEHNAARATALRQEAFAAATEARKLKCTDPLLDMIFTSVDANGADLRDPSLFSAKPEAAALIKDGEQAFTSGKYQIALTAYTKAFEIDPRSHSAALFIGDVHFIQKRYAEAITWFEKATTIDPDRETSFRYWADALVKLGRLDDARARYIDAVIASPYNRLPREALSRFALATKSSRKPPAVDLSQATVELKDGKTHIGIGSDANPMLIIYTAARGRWLEVERAKYFPADAAPRHSLPEECYGLRFLAEVSEGKSTDDPKTKSFAPSIATLKSLDRDGLLEAFVLLDRPTQGIAEDYMSYRLAHRAELVRYISTRWLDPLP
jgi:tetratricopeptide (TPR) repeat protein